ncbi:DUF2057 domain-containing protein [Kaarinaea lacus]
MNLITPGFFRYTIFSLIAVLAILLAACQSKPAQQAYDGPARAENEIATIIIPESFNLLFVDKNERGSLLSGGGAAIKVLPGSHELIIKYQQYWDLQTSDDHERTESKPIKIIFEANAGQTYRVSFKKPEDVREARSFAKNPGIEIIEAQSSNTVAANITYNLYSQGVIAGMIIKDSEPEASEPMTNEAMASEQTPPASTATPAAVTAPVVVMAAPSSSPSSASSASDNNSSNTNTKEDGRALEMLKYWWETASDNQRKAFQEWTTR